MPTRRRTSPLKLEPKGDMKELKKLLKDSPVVILVVFANWCGHCQTMKKNVWDPMCKRQRVNANNVAAVESSVLESAGEEGKDILNKVKGFPTVLEVVNGKIAKSLPPPQSPKELEELVNNAEQQSNKTIGAPGSTPFPKAVSTASNTSNTKIPEDDIMLYDQTEPSYIEREPSQASSLFTPQNQQYTPENDILTRMEQEQATPKPFAGGGNLYKTLRKISSGILPAGILGISSVRKQDKGKKSRKVRKSQKKYRKITRKY